MVETREGVKQPSRKTLFVRVKKVKKCAKLDTALVDGDSKWVGGKSHFVLCGDLVDRA